MPDKPKTQTLSIRLPKDLADRLEGAAKRHDTTRTAVLVDILACAIDTYTPATHMATQTHDDTLPGAIEALRIELGETIERVGRLERATHTAKQPATHIARQMHDEATRDGQTFTTQELIDLYGWSGKNGSRNARKNGWIEVGHHGREKLWRQG